MTTEVSNDVLNSELKIAIWQAGLNNKQLADAVGISAPAMSNIVNGAIPHLMTAQRIVRELNRTLPEDKKVSIGTLWPLPKEDE